MPHTDDVDKAEEQHRNFKERSKGYKATIYAIVLILMALGITMAIIFSYLFN